MDSPNIFPASPNRAGVSGDLTVDNSCEPDAEALSSPAVDGIAQTLRDLQEDGKRQKERSHNYQPHTTFKSEI